MKRRSYNELIERKRRKHGSKFDASDLADEFVRYFESGARIKVAFSDGSKLTGTVGITTGWRPSFLLMRTSRSIGSPYLLGHNDRVLEVTAYQPRS